MSEVKTLILRFRDLSIPNTIEEHKKIIAEKGYVWWGWWSKPQEKLPATIFMELNQKTELEVYLFDSGQKCFYKAQCNTIHYDTKGDEFTPDEKDCIPLYYRNQKYLAWFKLNKIEDYSDFFKKDYSYSYVEVPEFFNEESDFKIFNNKAVCSAEELYLQQRTIWFIREFNQITDTTQEIRVISDKLNTPRDVDFEFYPIDGNTLLWVSDLHFSEEYGGVSHHNFDNCVHECNKLSNIISKAIKDHGLNEPSAIIVTGDFTYSAKKEEFDKAVAFLTDLKSQYNLDSYRIAICPGNHDLSFSEDASAYGSSVTKTSEEAKKEYSSFYRQIYNRQPNDQMYSIRRFLTRSLVPVEIICLNSVVLQQDKEMFQGMGYVGQEQLSNIERELDKTSNTNAYRILILHHHLIPIAYVEPVDKRKKYSVTLDAGRIYEFINKNSIRLVLHGHGHKNFYATLSTDYKTKKSSTIIALGSTGAIDRDRVGGIPNMFGVLEFLKDKIEIAEYPIYPDGRKDSSLANIEVEITN